MFERVSNAFDRVRTRANASVRMLLKCTALSVYQILRASNHLVESHLSIFEMVGQCVQSCLSNNDLCCFVYDLSSVHTGSGAIVMKQVE